MIPQRLNELFAKEEPCTNEEIIETVMLFDELSDNEKHDIIVGPRFSGWLRINKDMIVGNQRITDARASAKRGK
jgi:hypothetical protein